MVSRLRIIGVAVLAATLVAACAFADFVEVRRHALIKTTPAGNAEPIREAVIGENLVLASETQQHGYYRVKLNSDTAGWIYRTLVRRFPGDPPDLSAADADVTAPPVTNALLSPHAYEGIPVSTDSGEPMRLLAKPYFAIGYSDRRRDPLWVCYTIEQAVDLISYPRKRFATDKQTTVQVTHDDYTHTDYSRGHMAPRFAISSRYGKDGNDATFIMSNVCPQYQDFNDGPWGNLEEWIAGRKTRYTFIKGWADEYERVWVTVGPIFAQFRQPLPSGVQVPSAFYCIVIDEQEGQPRAIAFILPHEDLREGDLRADLCTIREIEQQTHLDFFSLLRDDVEERLETTRAADLWPLPVNPN